MIDLNLLKEIIRESGKKDNHLAKAMGVSRHTLYNKLIGRSDFKTEEVNSICKELGINTAAMRNRIFFAKKVDNISTKEPK